MKPKPKIEERPGDRRFYEEGGLVFCPPGQHIPPVPDTKERVGPTPEFLRKLRSKPKAP